MGRVKCCFCVRWFCDRRFYRGMCSYEEVMVGGFLVVGIFLVYLFVVFVREFFAVRL